MLSGCAFFPFPHTEQVVPSVTGIVLRDGKPVSGTHVFVLPHLTRNGCEVSTYSAITDENGHFAIRGDRDLALFVVMGDRINSWGICIGEPGQLVEAWRARGFGFPPSSTKVECELTHQPIERTNEPAVCRPNGA